MPETDRKALADAFEGAIHKVFAADCSMTLTEQDAFAFAQFAMDNREALLTALRADASAETMRAGEFVPRMAYEHLARALLCIAERPNAKSAFADYDDSRAMQSYYEGYDSAAESRASHAANMLGAASIFAPLTGELDARFRALPTNPEGGA